MIVEEGALRWISCLHDVYKVLNSDRPTVFKVKFPRASISLIMPRCPQCCRKFKDSRAVLSHINQPTASCFGYQKKKRSLSHELEHYRRHKRPRITKLLLSSETTLHLEQQPQDDNGACVNTALVEPEGRSGMDVEDPPADNSERNFFIEKFPGAAEIFGASATFMDQFDQDPYSVERTNNVFYPFASRSEWELASYLLHSNLSMASIDKYLSLTLVCPASYSTNEPK